MDIIETTRGFAKTLMQEPCIVALNLARQASDEDIELQELIGRFNLRRMELNMQLGKPENERDSQQITNLDKEMKDIYEKVMGNQNMSAYNTAKQDVDKTMRFINAIVAAAANGEDPDTVEESACAGDCSGCQGCH